MKTPLDTNNNYIEYDDDGRIIKYWRNKSLRFHNIDGPAVIYYHKKGTIAEECWYIDGNFHRTDGPAITRYDEDGNIIREFWMIDGHYYRKDGPAYLKYHENSNIAEENWIIGGDYHRENGPAFIQYDENRSIIKREYLWYDINITKTVKKIFGCVPNKLTKEEQVLLKLSLPEECLHRNTQ